MPGSRAPAPGLLALLTLLAAACSSRRPPAPPTLVATVEQLGPVGYRDPLGVVDPSGRWLATAANDVLQVRPLAGGDPVALPAGTARILHLAWDAEGRLVTAQRSDSAFWWRYDLETQTRRPLWPARLTLAPDSGRPVPADRLLQLAWSSDGRVAGIEASDAGSRLWVVDSAGHGTVRARSAAELSYPAWLPDGRIACLALEGGRQRVTLPCGGATVPGLEDRDVYGPIGVAPDGMTLYLAIPNDSGFVATRAWGLDARPDDPTNGRLLGAFPRDAYAPSVTRDGAVLFKVQDYWTDVMVMPAGGGEPQLRTAFQAETPSWHWTGDSLGVTYGTWRRVVDDFKYPDIAQDAGIIAAAGPTPAAQPATVVQNSVSEDQGLTWSPNGKWIAFHSHQQGSDDVWLRRADSTGPAVRISRLGRGAEVGWPRWSKDGRWIVFDGDASRGQGSRSALWVIGIDQETGRVKVAAREVPLPGFDDDVIHAEWLGSSDEIVFTAFRPPRNHTVYRVRRRGGEPRLVYEYRSPQRFDGLGVSGDGAWLVTVEPDSAGVLQLYRILTSGDGHPEQLTTGPDEKTQPAISPDGRYLAYTRWRYRASFYRARP